MCLLVQAIWLLRINKWWVFVIISSFSLFDGAHLSVADTEGGLGGRLNPTPRPRPILNILWNWNDLVSVRPKYFIFVGFLRKMKQIQQSEPQHTFIMFKHMNPFDRNPGSEAV